jgi:hypothetical protein
LPFRHVLQLMLGDCSIAQGSRSQADLEREPANGRVSQEDGRGIAVSRYRGIAVSRVRVCACACEDQSPTLQRSRLLKRASSVQFVESVSETGGWIAAWGGDPVAGRPGRRARAGARRRARAGHHR